MNKSAVLSPCGTYRYSLTREWDASKPRVCWIMLNPSTADAEQDDPTIRRCIGFAERWQCGSIEVVNLFPLRATDPGALKTFDFETAISDGLGVNDVHILSAAHHAKKVICAWGNHGALHNRGLAVKQLLQIYGIRACALRVSKAGHPAHPLYLPYSLQPKVWV